MADRPLKMYILVRRTLPGVSQQVAIGLGVNAVGHTSLATYLRFKDDPIMKAWVTSKHFRKVTCIVSDHQFEKAKTYGDCVIMTENAIGDAEIALGFKPREEWPEFFRSLKLFGSHLLEPPIDPKLVLGYEVRAQSLGIDAPDVMIVRPTLSEER